MSTIRQKKGLYLWIWLDHEILFFMAFSADPYNSWCLLCKTVCVYVWMSHLPFVQVCTDYGSVCVQVHMYVCIMYTKRHESATWTTMSSYLSAGRIGSWSWEAIARLMFTTYRGSFLSTTIWWSTTTPWFICSWTSDLSVQRNKREKI